MMIEQGSIPDVIDLNRTNLVVVCNDGPVCGRGVNHPARVDIVHDRLYYG
jgi:hypothetical protein